jgi:hypothetical protein
MHLVLLFSLCFTDRITYSALHPYWPGTEIPLTTSQVAEIHRPVLPGTDSFLICNGSLKLDFFFFKTRLIKVVL